MIDTQGNLFILEDNQYIGEKRLGHPSFTRGEPVACAGEIKVNNGKVTYISNHSGHYQTGPYTLQRAVNELQQRGILAENCIIQDAKGEFFVKETAMYPNGKSYEYDRLKLSLAEFTQQYNTKLQEKETQAKPLELSEKPNPLKLFDTLSAINHYLRDRSHETSSILSIFGHYNGNDYYKRRENFITILEALKSGNFEAAISTIDKGLGGFSSRFFGRQKYADLLINLKQELNNYQIQSSNVLEIDFVHNKIEHYYSIYNQMGEHTKRVKAFNNNHSFFSKNQQTRADLTETYIDYKIKRQEMPENIKKEFANVEELHDVEYKNSNNF